MTKALTGEKMSNKCFMTDSGPRNLEPGYQYFGGNNMTKIGILKELWEFLKIRKSWWLVPIVVVLVLLGALILFTESSAVAPFIYTLF